SRSRFLPRRWYRGGCEVCQPSRTAAPHYLFSGYKEHDSACRKSGVSDEFSDEGGSNRRLPQSSTLNSAHDTARGVWHVKGADGRRARQRETHHADEQFLRRVGFIFKRAWFIRPALFEHCPAYRRNRRSYRIGRAAPDDLADDPFGGSPAAGSRSGARRHCACRCRAICAEHALRHLGVRSAHVACDSGVADSRHSVRRASSRASRRFRRPDARPPGGVATPIRRIIEKITGLHSSPTTPPQFRSGHLSAPVAQTAPAWPGSFPRLAPLPTIRRRAPGGVTNATCPRRNKLTDS